MKVYGNKILGSNLRFTFEVEGDVVSTADAMNIEKLNDVVADNLGGGADLGDVVDCLRPIANGGEVKIAVEEITED